MKIPSSLSPNLRPLAFAGISLILAVAAPIASAQNNPEEEQQPRASRVWGVSLPTGSYHVRIDRITSVSKAEYLIEGNILVTELTIDTVGQTTARFYYGEPYVPKSKLGITENARNRAEDIANSVKDRVVESGAEIDRLAIKTYGPPNTTHAKTIEFKVASVQEIDQIFNDVFNAWTSGRGRNLRIKDE